MTRKNKILVGVLLTGIVLLTFRIMFLTSLEKNKAFPLEITIREMLAPLQKGISSIINYADNIVAYFEEHEVLRRQNEQLMKENSMLREKIFSLQEQELENERLRELLAYQQEKNGNYDLVLAKVIGRNPTNWYEMIILDKGKKHGIVPGMVVVNHDGLIGKVVQVSTNTAHVLLILDQEGAVGGRIFENRYTPGVVVGVDNAQYLQMIHLPHDVPIEKNQTIVTSGLGGVYPSGIRIGKVIEVTLEPSGLMKTAKIKPFVDFDRLEEAFIIKQVKQPEEPVLPEDTGLDEGTAAVGGTENLTGTAHAVGTDG